MFIIMTSRIDEHGTKTEAFLIAHRKTLADAKVLLAKVVADCVALSETRTTIEITDVDIHIHDTRWHRVMRDYEIIEVSDNI